MVFLMSLANTQLSLIQRTENVLKQIFSNSNVFGLVPSRCHVNFPDFTTNSIKELKQKSFEQWMMDNIKKIVAKLYPLDLADE